MNKANKAYEAHKAQGYFFLSVKQLHENDSVSFATGMSK